MGQLCCAVVPPSISEQPGELGAEAARASSLKQPVDLGAPDGFIAHPASGSSPRRSVHEGAAGRTNRDEVELVRDVDCEAREAEASARTLMTDHRVLEAEEVLGRALRSLAGCPSREAVKATRDLKASTVYAAVAERARQYDAMSRLGSSDFVLVGNWSWARLWFRPGRRGFEFRSAVLLEASLASVVAQFFEVDLAPRLFPIFSEPPVSLSRSAMRVVSRMLVGIPFKVEMVAETLLFCNSDFGLVAARHSSDLPDEGLVIPKPRRWIPRVSMESEHLLLPVGGGNAGTIHVQQTACDLGIPLPDRLVKSFMRTTMPHALQGLRGSVAVASKPGEPWAQRIAEDSSGLYRTLSEVEAAAAKRDSVSLELLCGAEVFQRPWGPLPPFGQ